MIKRFITVILATAVSVSALSVSAHANSAQMHWSGVDATGTMTSDKNCPITVEREVLTFDIAETPSNYYEDISQIRDYKNSVTANYTFYNPADYKVTATLVFPFGRLPEYFYDRTDEVYQAEAEKYGVTLNGEKVKTVLRHTLSTGYFDLERDLSRLKDGYSEKYIYSPDLPVYKYTYKVSGLSAEKGDYTDAVLSVTKNGDSTLILEGMSGYRTTNADIRNTERGSVDVQNGDTVILWCLGDPENLELKWNLYDDGSWKTEVSGEIALTNTEEMSFEEFALQDYDPNSEISQTDWYNAMVDFLTEDRAGGICLRHEWEQDISGRLMRWYQYEMTLAPGERAENIVTAPVYPDIGTSYDPTLCDYTYLLSPAETWADFGQLDIVINTPFYIIDKDYNIDSFATLPFEKMDYDEGINGGRQGYFYSCEGLPEKDLVFSLCDRDIAVSSSSSMNVLLIIGIAALAIPVILAIAAGIVGIILVRKKS